MLPIIHRADESSLAKIREEMEIRNTRELFLLFGMGSQTDGLIMMQVAKLGVFCQLANPKTMTAQDVRMLNPKGIIISGGPYSVYSETERVPFDYAILELRIPVLGICLGFQMIARHLGGRVVRARSGEYSPQVPVKIVDRASPLFSGLPDSFRMAMSHGDEVLPWPILVTTARSENWLIAAGEAGHLYGIQGHPEKSHTEYGARIFENFCFGICEAQERFPAVQVADRKIVALRKRIGADTALITLSGGVDSSVSLELLRRAAQERCGQVHGLYIQGLDRSADEQYIRAHVAKESWLTMHFVDATDEFLNALKGIEDGAEKRRGMKSVYVAVIERMIANIGARWLVSGTNYADISESNLSFADIAPNRIELLPREAVTAELDIRKDQIKKHHNVGNRHSVPEIVPVVDLVKDSIRMLGREMDLPEALLMKQPFPGSGLSVRIDGEVTAEKLRLERELDRMWDEEVRATGHAAEIWQYGVDLLRSQVTTSRGDARGRGYRVTLWAKTSVNGFTAEPYPFEHAFLRRVAVRIAAAVPEVGGVEYDYMPKPPKTIEQS